ncbi:MAG TPA: hypothetical protein PLU36_10205 [Chitinophagaceae bacterium]|nr:hypothetical protein [Chitinophagaceae bacterium]HMZ47166.1 hypothetical protein [Chitinophagaceae bacterium]HNE92759.1 hypothetical protein [Chitinophagaceae bacterium]HNF30180.1 hypothetical protein [Chitinophagaceae bacterium]HNM35351.1 hypothetical protein [Chitinophagaceae bacterium]
MFNIKQLIKNILSYPIAYFILLKTRKLIIGSSNKRIFLFDIDNTIADSWHSLTLNIWANENERLKGLAIFLRMRKLVTILQKNKNNQVIFLTARSYFSRQTTENWLHENGILQTSKNLIITRTAKDKINIIKSLPLAKLKIFYIDDLSHKHEKGTVEMFEDEINCIKKLEKLNTKNFTYYGKSEIDKFCSLV